jgi:Fe-S cluster assembly protein SufD
METASALFVNDLRARGAKLVEAITQLPSSKDEAWKYTSLKTLFQHSYTAAATSADADPFLEGTLETHIDERCRRSCLVFIDGRYSPQHSCTDALKASPSSSAVTFSSLGQLRDAGGQMLEQQRVLIEQALGVDRDELPRNSFASDTITSPHLANTLDAAVLAVPAGVSVEVPLQVVFFTSGRAMEQRQAQHPKLLIDVKDGARVEIKQTYVGAGSGPVVAGAGAGAGAGAEGEGEKGAGTGALVIGLTRVNVGARSTVVHSYEQDLPLSAKHVEVVSAEVGGDDR